MPDFALNFGDPLQFESGVVAPENIATVPGAPTRTAIAGGRGRGGRADVPSAPPAPLRSGYPRGYRVEVSNDGSSWQTVADGRGTGTVTRIAFPVVQAKYVRITQTAATPDAPPWTIQRLRLYEPSER